MSSLLATLQPRINALEVCEYDRAQLTDALVSAWEDLANHSQFGDWFAGPHWLLPLYDGFFQQTKLCVFFVYQHMRLVAVLPLIEESTNAGGANKSLRFPTNTHVRRIGLLSDIPVADVLAAVFLGLKQQGRAHRLELDQVPDSSSLAESVVRASRAVGLHQFSVERPLSAIADFSGGWEPYVEALQGKHLHNLRKQKKMERSGEWQTRTFASPDELAEGWDALLAIERQSWKHQSNTSIANEPGAAAFYHDVAERCARVGMLRLHVSYHLGVPAAHTFGAVHRGTYFLLKHSFAEPFGKWSPGLLLVWQVMKESASSGVMQFDFLGDAMSWKLDFSTATPTYRSFIVFSPLNVSCQRTRFSEHVIKPLARRLGVVNLVRRLRQKKL